MSDPLANGITIPVDEPNFGVITAVTVEIDGGWVHYADGRSLHYSFFDELNGFTLDPVRLQLPRHLHSAFNDAFHRLCELENQEKECCRD